MANQNKKKIARSATTTEKVNEPASRQWLGILYWWIAPSRIFVNELVLTRAPSFYSRLSDQLLREHKLSDINLRHLKDYWDFFLLLDGSRRLESLRITKAHNTSAAAVAKTEYSQKNLREIKALFENSWRDMDEEKWLCLLGSQPQHKSIKELQLGKADSEKIDVGKFCVVEVLKGNWKEPTDTLAKFYIATEFFFGSHLVSGNSEIPELKQFREIKCVKDLLPNENSKLQECSPVCVKISLFADGITDILFFATLRTSGINESKDLFAAGFHASASSIIERRRQWLHDWIQRLKRSVADRLPSAGTSSSKAQQNSNRKKAIEFARDAISYMVRGLLQCENENNSEVTAATHAFLTTILEDGKVNDLTQLSKALKFCHPGEGHSGLAEPRINQVLNSFVVPACHAAALVIRGMDQGSLKGLLAIDTKLNLRERALNSPIAARLLLQGAPGGGKGAAAEDYHYYWMERLCAEIPSLSNKKEIATALGDSNLTLWKDPTFGKYIEQVARTLTDLFSLPGFYDAKDLQHPFLHQIEGTRWWGWYEATTYSCAFSKILIQADASFSEPERGLGRFLWELLKCDGVKTVSKEGMQKRFVAGYLSRFIQHLFSLKAEQKRKWDFNFVQITCGTLGGEGVELQASLRQLFGAAGLDGPRHALPGLFQICSYMGGTLFLDEIADAPIKIQDNLLMPLQEKKVFRSGWETFKEDVSNVRIVAATFKDLRAAAEVFVRSANTDNPQGFRPDLLTRLAGTPPISVSPISDYFLYESGVGWKGREGYRQEFTNLLCNMSRVEGCGKDKDISIFWAWVFDEIDQQMSAVVASQHRFSAALSEFEKRRQVALRLSMRFFMFMVETLKEAQKDLLQAQAEAAKKPNRTAADDGEVTRLAAEFQGRMSYLRTDYLPQMMVYLLNG